MNTSILTAFNAINHKAIGLDLAEVTDVANQTYSRPVIDTAVVYNRFNVDSIFAAALFAGRGCTIAATDQIVVNDYSKYEWLGVTPVNRKGGFIRGAMTDGVEHRVFTADADRQIEIGLMERGNTIFEKVAADIGIEERLAKVVGFMINNFYSTQLNLKELAVCYKIYQLAQKALMEDTVFDLDELAAIVRFRHNDNVLPEILNDEDVLVYRNFIRGLHRDLMHSVVCKVIKGANETIKVALCSLSYTNYVWALRAVRHTYPLYVNVTAGAQGYIVDSNIANLDRLKLVDDYYRAETY